MRFIVTSRQQVLLRQHHLISDWTLLPSEHAFTVCTFQQMLLFLRYHGDTGYTHWTVCFFTELKIRSEGLAMSSTIESSFQHFELSKFSYFDQNQINSCTDARYRKRGKLVPFACPFSLGVGWGDTTLKVTWRSREQPSPDTEASLQYNCIP